MNRQRKRILVVAGLLLAAFGLGVIVGTRSSRHSVEYREMPLRQASTETSAASSPATPGTPPACEDVRNASTLEGKNGCVSGVVLRVYTAASGNTFLDFCQDYRTCPFNSVIFAADKARFGDVGTLQGKRVELRGSIVSYQGRAEIVLHDPRQVRTTQ